MRDQEILTLNADVLDEKLRFVTYKEKQQRASIHDLGLLTSVSSINSIETELFETMRYKNEYLLLKNQIRENEYNREKSKKEADRFRRLHKEKLVSLSELEYRELEQKKLAIQGNMLIKYQSAKWHRELLSSRLDLNELRAEREQCEQERELYIIKSPIAGTVEQFSGISVGSFIQIGQLLIIISPDSDLIAEMYVSPRDIGLLNIGAMARIQVDTFNYNQWGLISGELIEISDNSILVNGQPFFRVRCKMNQKYLQLKSGYKGYLKKGMTVRARFLIAKRSLFQCLYDKVDDWLNPLQ